MPPRRQSTKGKPAPKPQDAPKQPDFYHHTIPRFILARYQSTPYMSNKDRQKIFRKTKKDPRKLQYFDLTTGVLEERSFSDVYGFRNLYRDMSALKDVDELEDKLSVLELSAKLVIDKIHDSAQSGSAAILRSEVETLRKFLFIMHYRSESVSKEYFNTEHPDHRSKTVDSAPWMNKMKRKTPMGDDATAVDLWLYCLRYYLDTPHNALIDAGRKWKQVVMERCMAAGDPYSGFSSVDDNEEAFAGAYFNQGDQYYLGIWRAAPGHEFIITHSGLGLWEGLLPDGVTNMIHRVFVISPSIALVLRSNDLKRHPNMARFSTLVDIPMQSAERISAVSPSEDPFWNYDDETHNDPVKLKAWQDRASAYRAGNGQRDMFKFTVPTLTPAQTDNFNFVLLINVRVEGGGISFLNGRLCGEMIGRFCGYMAQGGYRRNVLGATIVKSLGLQLTRDDDSSERSRRLVSNTSVSIRVLRKLGIMSHALYIHHLGKLNLELPEDETITGRLTGFLTSRFPSEYDRIYQVHSLFRDTASIHTSSEQYRPNGFVTAHAYMSAYYAEKVFPKKSTQPDFRDPSQQRKLVSHLSYRDGRNFLRSLETDIVKYRQRIGLPIIPCLVKPTIGNPEQEFSRIITLALYVGVAEKILNVTPLSLYWEMEQLGISICSDAEFERQMVVETRKAYIKSQMDVQAASETAPVEYLMGRGGFQKYMSDYASGRL